MSLEDAPGTCKRMDFTTSMGGSNLTGLLFLAASGLAAGACMGSLIANFVYRWPDRLAGMATGRSRCESCGVVLHMADLVPVLSWLLFRGHCRHCGAPVSGFYTRVELAAGFIGLVPMAMLPVVPGIAVAAAGWMLLAMALIDLDHMILPDSLTLPLLVLGLLLALAMPILAKDWPGPGIGRAVAGAVVGGGGLWLVREVYWRLRGREGLGLGDVKLMAAAGAWLGPEPLTWVLLTAALAGLAFALRRGLALRSTAAVPFGPSLALAFWVTVLLSW